MAENREAVRTALDRAAALVKLASAVLEESRRQDDGLRTAVMSCRVPLPASASGKTTSPLAGMTALALARSGRPSQLVETVAAQAHSGPAVKAQVYTATEVQSRLPEVADAARPAAHSPLRGLFSSKATRQHATAACARLTDMLRAADANGVEKALQGALSAAATAPSGTPDAGDSCRVAADVLALRVPSNPPVSLQREQRDPVRRFLSLAPAVLKHRPPLVTEVERAFKAVQDRMVAKQLREIPTPALKQATGGRVRFKTLSEAGCETVEDVLLKALTPWPASTASARRPHGSWSPRPSRCGRPSGTTSVSASTWTARTRS